MEIRITMKLTPGSSQRRDPINCESNFSKSSDFYFLNSWISIFKNYGIKNRELRIYDKMPEIQDNKKILFHRFQEDNNSKMESKKIRF